MLWHIQKTIDKGRYLMALVPEHPKANKDGYVAMHRVVMENKLGRLLLDNEVVHHRNEDKKDNRPGNLRAEIRGPHTAHHTRVGVSYVVFKCPVCGRKFVREKRNTHLVKGSKFTACNTSCSMVMNNAIRRWGMTTQIKKRLKSNVQREFIE